MGSNPTPSAICDLPPRNTGAFDLHLTDLEFEGLLAFLRSQQRIGRAWIFGSRRSGRRRPKDVVKPADIDVAVELVDVPEADTLLAMFDVRFAANDFFVHGHPQASRLRKVRLALFKSSFLAKKARPSRRSSPPTAPP